ncbi:PVC-type heme-binding CxxCH protein [Pedobacter foliorum]|uniref:PVC-type heme-binding CxxCH protein n=1 Tax=Pedobacter foliorum TaxID=2739058 RepID=UPI00156616F5|nr:PVC-type heme-binding CxxCH protein [Pedobacter foliorum]NRF40032.1 c-type cytochrome [Pedobacter foliorum]
MAINFTRTSLFATKIIFVLFQPVLLFKTCNAPASEQNSRLKVQIDSPLTESAKHLPGNSLAGLHTFPGLHVQTMATEPTLINPTNIDVDEKGRVWVTEAYNYRFEINNNKPKPEGDRILILEDKDGDGTLETSKTFYQGAEINAPLGICVLGNRVIVSQSPYVWAFYDDNGDDKADRKEILFQGIGGEQHDHGIHSFTFGPDGKLYFNFGNMGETLKDKNNKTVLDQDGDEIGPKKYKEGMAFRCDPDGSNVEVLGHNFRNPFEVAVDSYGTVWQSDNDDDGNKGVRINYVMEHGNFGFKDEMTGAYWPSERINMEDSIPLRHWHLNDPGVVPNLLQTGSGSPTGILIYEGSLLPAQFHNQIIHSEPGHNVVRSYPVKKNGAGYTADIVNILNNDRDQWFRPADVCIAPDGSLIIADWYDPGVGGHRVGDLERGRIYRVAPTALASKYVVPKFNFDTPTGAVAALQNPNLAVRRHAYLALIGMNEKAIPALKKLWNSTGNQRMRARALWILSKSADSKKYIDEAIADKNPDIRITGLRAARQTNLNTATYVKQLVNDPSMDVLRECAITLRHNKTAEAAELWAKLAAKHNGTDRWYLEALGIGADKQWDAFLAAYLKEIKDPLATAGGKDIIWRSRTALALPLLEKLASDQNTPLDKRLRYFRAFDFIKGIERTKALLSMLNNNTDLTTTSIILSLMDAQEVSSSPVSLNAVKKVLNSKSGTSEYIGMITKYQIKTEGAKLLDMVIANGNNSIGIDAARLLIESKDSQRIKDAIKAKDLNKTTPIFEALGTIGNKESMSILSSVVTNNSYDKSIRQKAVEMMGKSRTGETAVLGMLKTKALTAELIPFAVKGLSGSGVKGLYDEAKTYLPDAKADEAKKGTMVNFNEIIAFKGSALKGKAVYNKACFICHKANGQGMDFGPNLSEIGAKLPKEGLFDAIVRPSAGVSFGYETSQLDMKDGSSLVGIVSSRTESDIQLKYPGGAIQKLKSANVNSIKEVPGSMMPEGLHESMTKQEFSDLLEFLSSLKKKEQ